MGLKLPYEIQCSCGSRFQAELWEYIFAEHDPELKELVLSGEFNRVTCPSCKEELMGDIGFLYRDETSKLWIWVCGKADQGEMSEISVDEKIQGHYLDNQDDYRKYVVCGREGLLEILLKEDQELKKTEDDALKSNPAVKALTKNPDPEGYLFLIGDRIKTISVPLSSRFKEKNLFVSPEEKEKWLEFYSEGVNLHNPYSTFLDDNLALEWRKLIAEESSEKTRSEYEMFAELWAAFKMKGMGFGELFPKVSRFFQGLSKIDITRDIVSFQEDCSSQ